MFVWRRREGGKEGGRKGKGFCLPCCSQDVHGEEEVEQSVALKGDEDDLRGKEGRREGSEEEGE